MCCKQKTFVKRLVEKENDEKICSFLHKTKKFYDEKVEVRTIVE